MSPTSYQAAPPREQIIAESRDPVKRIDPSRISRRTTAPALARQNPKRKNTSVAPEQNNRRANERHAPRQHRSKRRPEVFTTNYTEFSRRKTQRQNRNERP